MHFIFESCANPRPGRFKLKSRSSLRRAHCTAENQTAICCTKNLQTASPKDKPAIPVPFQLSFGQGGQLGD